MVVGGLGLLLGAGCDSGVESPDIVTEDLRERVQQLYDRAREAGEDVPADAYEWAESDLRRIGDWEFRVFRRASDSDADIERVLNGLGEDRWEVYWVEAKPGELRFFLKRTARSYLRMIPFGELGRLAPGGAE